MKTYNSIQGEAEGPEASRTEGITEYREQRVSSNRGEGEPGWEKLE